MALIICKECQKEFSDSVKACPHCGKAKLSKLQKFGNLVLTAIGSCIIIFVLVALFGLPAEETTPPNARHASKQINFDTALLSFQSCVGTSLMLGSYTSDTSLSPVDNILQQCSNQVKDVSSSCMQECKRKHDPSKCHQDICDQSIRNVADMEFQKFAGPRMYNAD